MSFSRLLGLDMMNWKVEKTLGIEPTNPLTLQDPSKPSQVQKIRKKTTEFKPETFIAGLHCNRALPERVKFRDVKVIEQPEHGIFFIDAFNQRAFQRVSDVEIVDTSTLIVYKIKAALNKTPESDTLCAILDTMIQQGDDKDLFLSKKTKPELMVLEE